ncbi:hypothetical protein ACM75Z_30525 [Pseudomonas aeruginosa]
MHIDKIQFTPVTEALPELDTTWAGRRKDCLVVVSENGELRIRATSYTTNVYAKTEKGRAPRWEDVDSNRLFHRPERIIAWAPWPALAEELPDLNSDSPLARLQSFVEGFEDDEAQEGMQELLHILPQVQQVMNTALMALMGYLPGHRNAVTDKAIDDLRQILGYGGENKPEYRTPCCNAAVDEGEWCSGCGANLTTGTTLPPTGEFIGSLSEFLAQRGATGKALLRELRTMLGTSAQHSVPQAWLDVQAERRRQVENEGWTPEHDDGHACDEIAAFACYYAMPPAVRDWDASSTGYGATLGEAVLPEGWEPKTGDRRRELVKACALALAEIERLDRTDLDKEDKV